VCIVHRGKQNRPYYGFYSAKYAPGKDLKNFINTEIRDCSLDEIFKLWFEILKELAALKGWVHRDIKPDNFVLKITGNKFEIETIDDVGVVKEGSLVDPDTGTSPLYASFSKLAHPAQDINGAGVILLELLMRKLCRNLMSEQGIHMMDIKRMTFDQFIASQNKTILNLLKEAEALDLSEAIFSELAELVASMTDKNLDKVPTLAQVIVMSLSIWLKIHPNLNKKKIILEMVWLADNLFDIDKPPNNPMPTVHANRVMEFLVYEAETPKNKPIAHKSSQFEEWLLRMSYKKSKNKPMNCSALEKAKMKLKKRYSIFSSIIEKSIRCDILFSIIELIKFPKQNANSPKFWQPSNVLNQMTKIKSHKTIDFESFLLSIAETHSAFGTTQEKLFCNIMKNSRDNSKSQPTINIAILLTALESSKLLTEGQVKEIICDVEEKPQLKNQLMVKRQ